MNSKIDQNFGRIMVLVPHPDDEILMCAGILAQAVQQGVDAFVVLVTNGDYEGQTDGKKRLQESLDSVAMLGVPEKNVIFMGYADVGMAPTESFLYGMYTDIEQHQIHPGHVGQTTYGLPHKPDYHSQVFGQPALYTRHQFLSDLGSILKEYQPENIFTTSVSDMHGDHSGLYLLLMEVLEEMKKQMAYVPRVFSGIVHSKDGDEHWPVRSEKLIPLTVPSCIQKEAKFLKGLEMFPVPDSMQQENKKDNLKYQALSCHKTALKPDAVDFLYSFVKLDEIFWRMQ